MTLLIELLLFNHLKNVFVLNPFWNNNATLFLYFIRNYLVVMWQYTLAHAFATSFDYEKSNKFATVKSINFYVLFKLNIF